MLMFGKHCLYNPHNFTVSNELQLTINMLNQDLKASQTSTNQFLNEL